VPVLTDYLSRRGEILVLVLVVVISVTLMLLSSNDKVAVAGRLNDAAFTPFQIALTRGGGLLEAKAENDSLRTELMKASLHLMGMQESERENARLRSMLSLREEPGWNLVAARVLGREASRSSREFKIDKGARDGLRKNLAVVTIEGLLGRVTKVGPHSAFVRPLCARHCNVSVRLARTRTEAILEWSPELGLNLTFLPFRAEFAPGDEVVTSGLGGVFPRGILVGSVSHIETLPDGSLRALVEPKVRFDAVDEVFVVFESPEGEEEDILGDPEPSVAVPQAAPAGTGRT
jgi:rod shape-determining protein MreC